MSKDEVIAAIQECAEKLGRRPNLQDLRSMRNVTMRIIVRHFGTYARAVAAAGMEARGSGFQVSLEDLFNDWARLVRTLGRIPTVMEYELNSQHSARPLTKRFGKWTEVPRGLLRYAEEMSLEKDWSDVLDLIRGHKEGWPKTSFPPSRPGFRPCLPGRPTYGSPLMPTAMAHAPTCEQGVIFLFGMLAERLGFQITRIQTAFPDCEAMQRIDEERWQRVRIEFELESRNYLVHGHPVEGCDLIVCWIHNWAECPVEVLELRSVVSEWQKNRA